MPPTDADALFKEYWAADILEKAALRAFLNAQDDLYNARAEARRAFEAWQDAKYV